MKIEPSYIFQHATCGDVILCGFFLLETNACSRDVILGLKEGMFLDIL